MEELVGVERRRAQALHLQEIAHRHPVAHGVVGAAREHVSVRRSGHRVGDAGEELVRLVVCDIECPGQRVEGALDALVVPGDSRLLQQGVAEL